MLHGHAKIELTNVKTGEKKVIEHDNMLTNWIRDMFTPKGLSADSMVYAYMSEELATRSYDKESLFGGIVLFEDELSSDANDYSFPSGNKMIAHGCRSMYSGTDLTFGMFNSEQSSVSDTEMTSVWDFTQERGNGTISSLGLCNYYAGRVGAGQDNPDTNVYLLGRFLKVIHIGNNSGALEWKVAYTPWVSIADSAFYCLRGMASGVLTIAKVCFAVSEYDPIRQKIARQVSSYTIQDDMYTYDVSKEELITVNIASYISGNNIPASYAKDGVIYLTASGTWANGASKTFVKYTIATRQIATQSVTNNTGKTISMNAYVGSWAIFGDDMYFQTSDHMIVRINMTDNTDSGVMKDRRGTNIVTSGTVGNPMFVVAFGALHFSQTIGLATNCTLWTVEAKDRAVKRAIGGFGKSTTTNYSATNSVPATDDENYLVCISTNFSGQRVMTRHYNWLALSTKQNLDTPVTKTSDMTMRVTYTIREVGD